MRKIVVFVAFLLSVSAFSQARWNQAYQQYVNQYKDIAIEQMQRYRIPASITLAQGLLESGAGRSELTRNSNNHFGIKCNNGWTGRRTYHDDDQRNDCFRVYDNAFESYEDHSKFLANNQRYRSLFNLKTTDYRGWAKGLKAAGYATNPIYAEKLIEIIQLYKLYQYDTAKGYDHFMAERTKVPETDAAALHSIKIFNKNYYLIARRGDTYKSIGKEVGISYRKIAKYNERNRKDQLKEGEVVWLKKKQRKAPKDYKGRLHYVREGESMYSIAQLYGIRLKNLYKINHLSPEYQIRVGDGLKLR
ncbi:glucosaminidase domain-containing protein [Prevotella sp. MA2016]|uniref:glucosaminidase domain-containing protein n=1 Tax=Prevotella sp. MA2016 TaxID=1408310 RepID=UPI00048D145F|nr:glucosaminidase domain-containing protein [Prevotella sp. MA2016]